METRQAIPSLALAAYSEDLVSGRRLVIFGNALSGLAETLVERGARLVHVYDENTARVGEAAARSTNASISFAPLTPGGIAARDGAFDVAFVEEVTEFADPVQLVTKLRRALSARGVGFVCTANPDVSSVFSTAAHLPQGRAPLSYYELYDLVSTQFDEVRMVGQTPFVGYALADFSPDSESEFSIDTGFVPGGAEEPERYVAVCSHFPVSLEPFCVVQMQAASLLTDTAETIAEQAPPQAPQPDAALAELRRELAVERSAKEKLEQLLRDVNEELRRRDEWVHELESRAATADERADAAEGALERLNAKRAREEARPSKDAGQVAELTQQLNQRTQELRVQERRVQELELKLAEGERHRSAEASRLTDLERRFLELQTQLAHAEKSQRLAEAAHEAARAEVQKLEQEREQNTRAQDEITELQATVVELRAQVSNVRSDLHLAGDEIARAELQLIERGETVRSLREELAETERFAALLLAERDFGAASASPKLEDQKPDEPVNSPAEPPEPRVQLVAPPEVEQRTLPGTSSAPDPSLVQQAPLAVEVTALAEARAREAELQAALQATRWTVEELENRLTERSNEPELLERLYRAERQLQRQATLIEQYERGARAEVPADHPTQ
jgi:hypothetical protein